VTPYLREVHISWLTIMLEHYSSEETSLRKRLDAREVWGDGHETEWRRYQAEAAALRAAIGALQPSDETPAAPSVLQDILACLEYREGARYLVQVREGDSESFWAALADAFSQRRPAKAIATPPFSGIVDSSISQYRFENDDGSEKADAGQVMRDVARRAAALIPAHSEGGEGPTLEINLNAQSEL
jgi:hypothetical protein